MTNLEPHQSFRLSVEGRGGMGFVTGQVDIALDEQAGKTTVQVEADSQVGGPVARVGQRLMEAAARSMMDQFFDCLRRSVNSP
jgi:carbon monoxide dehydrogenase subunit G